MPSIWGLMPPRGVGSTRIIVLAKERTSMALPTNIRRFIDEQAERRFECL
jgi:hypothetical protein